MKINDRNVIQGDIVRRALVQRQRSINEQERTIEFVSSDESIDRYGDVIRASGWDYSNYMRNPVFLWAHNSRELPIGRTEKIWVETSPPALVQLVKFATLDENPRADQAFRLYMGGYLSAVSVGFKPKKHKKIEDAEGNWTGGYEFIKQELLELSAVPVPANPNALARAVDEGLITKDEERDFEEYALLPEESVASIEKQAKKIQTLIFSKKNWTQQRASSWCKSHGLRSDKVDETDSSYRYRQFDPSMCSPGSYQTLTENMPAGLSMVVCSKKDSEGGEERESGELGMNKKEPTEEAGLREVLDRHIVKGADGAAATKSDLQAVQSNLSLSLEAGIKSASDAFRSFFERAEELFSRVFEELSSLGRKADRLEKSSSSLAKESTVSDGFQRFDDLSKRVDRGFADAPRKQHVSDIAAQVSTQKSSFEAFTSSFNGLATRFELLRDASASDADVKGLAADVSSLRGAVTVISGSLAKLVEAVSSLKDSNSENVENVKRLCESVARLADDAKTARASERTVCPFSDDRIEQSVAAFSDSAEIAKVASPAGWRKMATVIVGDLGDQSSYKLVHHRGGGDWAVSPLAVRAALERFEQTEIPPQDRAAARVHLVKHQVKISSLLGREIDAEEFERELENIGRVYRSAKLRGDTEGLESSEKMIMKHIATAFPVKEKEEPKVVGIGEVLFGKKKAG